MRHALQVVAIVLLLPSCPRPAAAVTKTYLFRDSFAPEEGAGNVLVKGLQEAGKAVSQYVHRLAGLRARKKLDGTLRTDFMQAGQAIEPDLGSLRAHVQGPPAWAEPPAIRLRCRRQHPQVADELRENLIPAPARHRPITSSVGAGRSERPSRTASSSQAKPPRSSFLPRSTGLSSPASALPMRSNSRTPRRT